MPARVEERQPLQHLKQNSADQVRPTADPICCLFRIQEHQLPEQGEQEIFAADDERSLWNHCSVVALFEPRHEVHGTLRDAQKILGVQVGHWGRLQRMHRAQRHPLQLCTACFKSLALLPAAALPAVPVASMLCNCCIVTLLDRAVTWRRGSCECCSRRHTVKYSKKVSSVQACTLLTVLAETGSSVTASR